MEAAGEMAAATATSEAAEAAAVEEAVQAALQQAPWRLEGAAAVAATETEWTAAIADAGAVTVAVVAGEFEGRAGVLYGVLDGEGTVILDDLETASRWKRFSDPGDLTSIELGFLDNRPQ
jgi:hypothetical protein